MTPAADSFDCGHGAVIHADEMEENFIRAAGPGGQNVNKVASAVQLRVNVHEARGLSEALSIAMTGQAVPTPVRPRASHVIDSPSIQVTVPRNTSCRDFLAR